jgi:hypothetical protein
MESHHTRVHPLYYVLCKCWKSKGFGVGIRSRPPGGGRLGNHVLRPAGEQWAPDDSA